MLLYSLKFDFMFGLFKSALKIILTQYNNTVMQLKLWWRHNNDYTSCFARQVFDIFIFFPEVAPNIMSLYYNYQTVIICLNQINTPHAAFLVLSHGRFLVQETFPKTLPRFVLILISLQRWQQRAHKETKHFVSPHLIGPQLHQHDSASK